MAPLNITVSGQAFTVEQNDSYGVLSGKALLQAQSWGDQLTTMVNQISQDAVNLNMVADMSSWQPSDWDDCSTAGEQTILDRQASLQSMGLAATGGQYTFVSTVSGAGPGNVQLPDGNAFGPNVENVTFDGGYANPDGTPFFANAPGSTSLVVPRQDVVYLNSVDAKYYVVDANNRVWQIGNPGTWKQFNKPTAADLANWQSQFQSLSTRWSGQSTSDNAIMQDLTNSYETALLVFTNTQQARAQVLTDQAKNLA
jgi:hypothetical protein